MAETFQDMTRSMRVAELGEAQLGQELTLMGWCHKQRDIGKLVFLTLRDRSGELQLLVDENAPAELLAKAQRVRSEYVLAVRGTLRRRQDPNPNMPTGNYELLLTELRILSESKTPPFYIEDGIDARESLRLEYRYLDLRRPEMQKKIMLRHRVNKFTRDWFDAQGFLEIETPFLIKSTPEGARDYLVPSRIFQGKFFALPQSPQIYKQLLMCSGFDRYFQLARCFRDEDLRADRQPEFTQLDIEMSFVRQEDVMNVMQQYLHELFRQVGGIDMPLPFEQLSWEECLLRYGSDKPDRRFGMEIRDVSDLARETEFGVFRDTLSKKKTIVAAIALPGGSQLKRRRLDELTQFARDNGASGLVWMSLEEPLRGSASKYLKAGFMDKVAARLGAARGDMVFFVADEYYRALTVLGRLRVELAHSEKLIPQGSWAPLWVYAFPMFERDEETGGIVAMHHPFTMPLDEDVARLETDPESIHAKAYDLVLNGYELGSGSIRIYDPQIQSTIFKLIGLSRERAEERFGFLLRAFEYGVPPHGGIALGMDRINMLLSGTENIRDVIAFPKVQNSSDLMSQAPGEVDEQQLIDLGIAVTAPPAAAGENV